MRRRLPILLVTLALATVSIPAYAAATIAGTVKDPSGALIGGVQVTARNEATGETRATRTDDRGRFTFDDLAAGSYAIRVTGRGFKPAEHRVSVEDARTATLEVNLEIPETREEISVAPAGGLTPNSDPNYRALRDGQTFETYSVEGLTLTRDLGVLTLTGSVSFLSPVLGRITKAVFVGDGEFTLTPPAGLEKGYLTMLTGADSVSEAFNKALLYFTDGSYDEIKSQAKQIQHAAQAPDVLREFHGRLRSRTDRPRSLLEALLKYEDVENIEAEILADILNPNRPGFFAACIAGRKHGDLRFKLRPRGAFPQLPAPEEVALYNLDPGGDKEGIWYLGHLMSEYRERRASSEEDKRVIDVENYRIETAIDGGEKLTAAAEITFTALGDGERVLGFGLLPSLRVTRVTFGDRETHFTQEKQKEDGSLYVVLPEALVKGKQYKVGIEYGGTKVIEDAGGGNFAVGARTSWYPSVNSFTDRATFDLTFKVPSKYTLVGVGKLIKEWREGGFAASQWVSDVPLAVAGFNYGMFKKKSVIDSVTKYEIEAYATSQLPASLREAGEEIGGMTPTRLSDKAIVEAQNSMRIFTKFFGEAPYGRVAITQQPQFNFGQSWPTLVYLPIIAFFDSTQRWQLMGGISQGLTDFIQELTPHEVAHQWWGHIVGWASYHDQWLSEGFADFSAALYLHITEQKPDKFIRFWDNSRKAILEKNRYGRRANDAGPIWMGLRLITPKTPGAYGQLVYPKGGYVLHMLRMMMFDNKTGDEKFIAMMKDFVKTYFNKNASTEGFKQVLEKHMTPLMDLEGNGRMDWFFRQWVYGTEVPTYRLEYTLAPEADGKVMLTMTVTQSGVSDDFKMLVPIYLDFDGRLHRLGQATVIGSSSVTDFKVRLPRRPKRVLLNGHHDVLADGAVSVEKGK